MVKKMDIVQYFNTVLEAQLKDDSDKVEKLAQNEGMQDVKMKDVERLVAYTLNMVGMSQRALMEKEQTHFEIIVEALNKLGVANDLHLTQDIIDTLVQQDEEINRILEED